MYAIAHPVFGFRSSSLRVRVLRDMGTCCEVITADLSDAGTRLVLDKSKLSPEADVSGLYYPGGLVELCG